MAQSHEGSASFDVLPIEVLERIIRIVREDSPGVPLEEIATLNKTFREAARRCSTTLVLRNLNKAATIKALPTGFACKALEDELKLRPLVSGLVVWKDSDSGLWPALKDVQWTRVKLVLGTGTLGDFLGSLEKSKDTLETLDVDLGSRYPASLVGSVRSISHLFPRLQTLVLNGGKGGDDPSFEDSHFGGACNVEDGTGSLAHLDIVGYEFKDWSDAIRRSLPLSLTTLTSLRFQCSHHRWLAFSPEDTLLKSALTRLRILNLDLWYEFVPRSVLRNIGVHCPLLKRFVLHATPRWTNYVHEPCKEIIPPLIDYSDILERCLELEFLAISQGVEMPPSQFVKRLQETGCLPAKCAKETIQMERLAVALADNIYIVGDYYDSHPFESRHKRLGVRTEVIVSILMVQPTASQWDRRGKSANIKDRMLGDAALIQHWLRAFC